MHEAHGSILYESSPSTPAKVGKTPIRVCTPASGLCGQRGGGGGGTDSSRSHGHMNIGSHLCKIARNIRRAWNSWMF
jgi:hypothetical protein